MRGSKIFALLGVLPLVTQAANIVLSNDDGWAEINIRTLFDALTKAGENVVLSAPAENKSGSGRFAFPNSHVSIHIS
jgi:5'/3'-nucleotidase SurE